MKGACIILSSSRSGCVGGWQVRRGGERWETIRQVRYKKKGGGDEGCTSGWKWVGVRSIGVGEPWEGERKPWSEKETMSRVKELCTE